MAKVKALYSYSYDYEGSKISFKCGDEFQLLAKVNPDWWHVRRWIDQGSQDIYIPAVYVKEVGVEANPLYENMADLKKQVDEFKKKESSTPPPPTARKPKHDRSSNDKIKAVVRQDVPLGSAAPDNATETESVAHRAKKLAENFQAKKQEEESGISKTGSTSPLVLPKRSQSTRRDEEPGSPRATRKLLQESGSSGNILSVASKPRSRSMNTRPADKKDENSVSSTDLHQDAPSTTAKKQPPPVLPKMNKLGRPKSMLMFSPTEDVSEEVFASALQSQLTEQIKQRSVNSAGVATTATGVTGSKNGDQKSSQGDAQPHTVKPEQNGAIPHDATPAPVTSFPSPSPSLTAHKYVLPDGWTEHKTNEGHTYYYNATTGKSSWTRPPSAKKTTPTASPTHQNGQSVNPLEKIAPRGWTKEINPLSQTPIYTNSKTNERWALAKDGTGNYYYYNMANSQLTVGELPDVADLSSNTKHLPPQDNVYDHISPLTPSNTEHEVVHSDPRAKPDRTSPDPSPSHSQPGRSLSGGMLSTQLEVVHHSLAHMQLKKHGYLQRKKLFDAQGKRGKGGWQRVYTSLDNFQLKFYTDHKIAMEAGAKPLGTFHLLHATVCTYTKEKKIKHAFLVSSPFGEQFILQAEASPQMNDWYSTIQTSVHKANEDYKIHPDKYKTSDIIPEGDGEISPRVPVVKGHRRKPSKDILMSTADDDDELDDIESVADKSDRIRNRLRRLMAKRPQMETLQKKGIIEDPVFGADLAKYCERKKTNVPQFLVHFMEHIESNGLDTVGLYRLSGNAASVQKLRCLVEQDEPFNLNDPEWADINIVTGCLKLYFRELPDPLIPANKFKTFIDAARLAGAPAQRIAALAAQVRELPRTNYCTLLTLMKHLRKVMENASVNKMYSQNVAIVFGPTLLRAEGDPFEMAKLTPLQNGIVELMLIEFDKIFTKK